MRVLLIGNGPSATAKELGGKINFFDGKVARFNAYKTEGCEKYVGNRIDIWITVGDYPPKNKGYSEIYWVSLLLDHQTDKRFEKLKEEIPQIERFPYSILKKTKDNMGFNMPSSGAVATTFFLDRGDEVYLYGFDFMQPYRKHHYSDSVERGPNHNPDAEWLFFQKYIEEGKVKQFSHNSEKEGIPIIRQPVFCGSDDNLSAGRTSSQMGWYDWIGEKKTGKTILDVGAGMCDGMKKLEEYGCNVSGFEIDKRLSGLHDKLVIGKDLSVFEDNSFDVVSCVDVIEHVIEDKVLLEEMKRIAKEKLYVSTPNFSRSRAQSHSHCREYTIGQFMNVFQPNEIWCASPDGWLNRTLVIDKPRHVDLEEKFDDTVDGKEWAHFCAIFNC